MRRQEALQAESARRPRLGPGRRARDSCPAWFECCRCWREGASVELALPPTRPRAQCRRRASSRCRSRPSRQYLFVAASARAALLRTKPSSAIADSTFTASPFGHEVGVVEHIRNGADCDPGTPCHILDARCARLGIATHRWTGPSSRPRHAGRLYPDSCLSEAIQPSQRAGKVAITIEWLQVALPPSMALQAPPSAPHNEAFQSANLRRTSHGRRALNGSCSG